MFHLEKEGGLVFFGGLTDHGPNSRMVSFGAAVDFELHRWRIPPPPASGLWRSSPYVGLHGAFTGYTGEEDKVLWIPAEGDHWSKLWLNRQQTLWMKTNGGRAILAHAEEHENIAHEENAGRRWDRTMPGYKPMPPIVFHNAQLGVGNQQSLWATLTIRFDVLVEDAFVWLDPKLILQLASWELMPV